VHRFLALRTMHTSMYNSNFFLFVSFRIWTRIFTLVYVNAVHNGRSCTIIKYLVGSIISSSKDQRFTLKHDKVVTQRDLKFNFLCPAVINLNYPVK
jgi:hypothetical protein